MRLWPAVHTAVGLQSVLGAVRCRGGLQSPDGGRSETAAAARWRRANELEKPVRRRRRRRRQPLLPLRSAVNTAERVTRTKPAVDSIQRCLTWLATTSSDWVTWRRIAHLSPNCCCFTAKTSHCIPCVCDAPLKLYTWRLLCARENSSVASISWLQSVDMPWIGLQACYYAAYRYRRASAIAPQRIIISASLGTLRYMLQV